MNDLTGPESSAEREYRRVNGSSFGAAAAAYAEHRPDYAEAAVRWALEPVRGRRPLRVLDLAAGTGKLTAALAGLGAEVTAVEPDPAMLAELRRRLPAIPAGPGRAEEIPLPDGSVDAVLVGQALHWFDLDRAVPEIARVLAPGGVLAALWNVDDDRVGWVAALDEVSKGRSNITLRRWRDGTGHARVQRLAAARRPARAAGDPGVPERAAADGRGDGGDGRHSLELPDPARARPVPAAGPGPGPAARAAGNRRGRVRAPDGDGRAADHAAVAVVKVALFVTCLVDGVVPQVAQATVRVLERLGVRVEVPWAQTCCGQVHVNSGYPREAIPLVRNHVAAFGGYDAIVVPSGSCTAAIRHQHASLARLDGSATLAAEAAGVAGRTWELSEFLVDVLGVTDVGAWFPHRVTYHPSCHSLRLLGVGDRPLRLLRAVEGIDLAELPGAEQCCGFGGTFAVKNAAVSGAMLADKIAAVRQTGAAFATAGDASCLMHIGGGLSRLRTGIGTRHLAEILAATREDP